MIGFDKLCFKGGGVLGFAHVGVIQALTELGLMKNITHVAGTSAGAIIGLGVALGKTYEQMHELLQNTDFKAMTYDCGPIRELFNLVEHHGLHEADAYTQWFGELIEGVVDDYGPDMTFGQWHDYIQANPDKGYCDLYVEACDINTGFNQVFSHKDTPDIPMRVAVRASMAVELFFTPQIINGDEYNDGGTQANDPISIFNKDGEPDPSALSLFLTSKEVIDYVESGVSFPRKEIHGLFGAIEAQVAALFNEQTWQMMQGVHTKQTVLIDSLGIEILDFDISEAQKQALVASGYTATIDFMKQYHPELIPDAFTFNESMENLSLHDESAPGASHAGSSAPASSWGDWNPLSWMWGSTTAKAAQETGVAADAGRTSPKPGASPS